MGDGQRQALLDYLAGIARPGHSLAALSDDDNLFDAGVLDSLAVIQIILYLEQQGIDLAASGVGPEQLGTIAGILAVLDSGA